MLIFLRLAERPGEPGGVTLGEREVTTGTDGVPFAAVMISALEIEEEARL